MIRRIGSAPPGRGLDPATEERARALTIDLNKKLAIDIIHNPNN